VWPDLKKNGEHFKETFPKWKRKNLSIQFPNMSVEAVDLLSKLLEYDPTKRPSAKEALAHPYFTGI
jgi:serine/threonine protein kinase